MAAGEASYEKFNFGLEDETGIGNQEILEGLVGGITDDPDELEEIDEEEEELKKKKKPLSKTPTVKKSATKQTEEDEEEEEEEEEDSLANLLEEDEEEDQIPAAKKKPAKKEEEAEEDPEEDPEEDGEEEDESEESSNPYTSLSKDLFKLGIFTAGEDEELPEITSPEQFLEQWQKEKKLGAAEVLDNFISRHGEDYQEAFQAIFINGVSPKEYMAAFAQVEALSELSLEGPENENNQIKVVRATLKEQGLDSEDIDAEIERLIQYGDLEVTSKRFHKGLVKREQIKLKEISERKAKEKENEHRMDEAYKASISKILNEKARQGQFDGIPLTIRDAQEAFDYMYTKKYKTANGELLTDFDREILELRKPENHELRVKLGLLLRNKLDLTKIKKAAVSSESSELFAELASKKVKHKTATKEVKKKSSNGGISSWFQ